MRAKNVEPLRTPRAAGGKRSRSLAPGRAAMLLAITALVAAYLAATAVWHVPLIVGAVYVGASIITFIAYAIDKTAARRNAWRTPESTLHILALAGGWPGALIAQQVLRHKTSKIAFRVVFWLTVIVNVAAFVALCSPAARALWAPA